MSDAICPTGPISASMAPGQSHQGQPGRVLLISGWGRCGSTLLEMLLGQVPGLVSAGEVREIWLRGCVENRPCGCGKAFRNCPFWSSVGDLAYDGWDTLDLDALLHSRFTFDRPWGAPRLVTRLQPGRREAELECYTDALSRLYRAIRTVSGASVVVDSSKIPTHGLILRCIPGLDVRTVHLVRDSRGVAYSTAKQVVNHVSVGEPTFLPRYGAMASAARYDLYNGMALLLRTVGVPYLRLRYEDLMADPASQLHEVLAHAGGPSNVDLSFLSGDQVELAENHQVAGNPVRHTQGTLMLRLDDEWRVKMAARNRWAVTALTLPFLAAYGYPLSR
jgi:Sulfotransferase family